MADRRPPVVALLSSPGFLAGAVLLIVAAWLLFGPRGGGAKAPPPLQIPIDLADRPGLLNAAEQFRSYEPTPADVARGMLFLKILSENLTEAEWPRAAEAVFIAWQRIHRTPGSHQDLEPFAGELLARLAPHLATAQYEQFIRSIRQGDFYAPRIDAALDQVAREPVPSSGYGGSKLEALVQASVRAGDFDRAQRWLHRARFAADAPEEARSTVERQRKAMDLHSLALAGRPEMAKAVSEWAKAPQDPVTAAPLLAAGLGLARSGRETGGFARLREAMEATREVEAAPRYWEAVIDSLVRTLPKEGQYSYSDLLDALAGEYVKAFKAPAFAFEFWTKLAEANKDKTPGEAMWRVECLKRAYPGAPDDAARLALLRRIAGECREAQAHGPGREVLETLSAKLEGEAAKAEAGGLLDELRKKEQADLALAARQSENRDLNAAQEHVRALKQHLEDARKRNLPRDVIERMERSIREMERKLAE